MLRFIKSITLVMALVLILSVTGVYSSWRYAREPIVPTSATLEIGIFPWAGSDILPEEDEIGQNHRTLIDAIINGEGIGLNTSNSYLNKQIEERKDGGSGWNNGRDTIGSMAVTQGDELNDLFALSTANLTFLIHFVSDTEYHIYTTGVYLGERGSQFMNINTKDGSPTTPIGQYIFPIYRTIAVKTDGIWKAVETKEGSAKSAWYEESRRNANATEIPSFDPDTWAEGNLTA